MLVNRRVTDVPNSNTSVTLRDKHANKACLRPILVIDAGRKQSKVISLNTHTKVRLEK